MEKKKTISKLTDFCKDLQKEVEPMEDSKQVTKGLKMNSEPQGVCS